MVYIERHPIGAAERSVFACYSSATATGKPCPLPLPSVERSYFGTAKAVLLGNETGSCALIRSDGVGWKQGTDCLCDASLHSIFPEEEVLDARLLLQLQTVSEAPTTATKAKAGSVRSLNVEFAIITERGNFSLWMKLKIEQALWHQSKSNGRDPQLPETVSAK